MPSDGYPSLVDRAFDLTLWNNASMKENVSEHYAKRGYPLLWIWSIDLTLWNNAII